MAECVFCKEEFADNPELEPVVYAPCQQCDVLYCRPCLEEYLKVREPVLRLQDQGEGATEHHHDRRR